MPGVDIGQKALYGDCGSSDTWDMNGIGIGTAVGLGAIVGLGLVATGAQVIEWVATGAFYGFLAGMLFEFYRFAFTWKPPFSR